VILQAGFFATPILYPIDIFGEELQRIFLLNPMAHIIMAARDTIIYSTPAATGSLLYAGVMAVISLVAGYVIFAHYEPRFAEEM